MPENNGHTLSRDLKQKLAIAGLSLTVLYLIRKNTNLQMEIAAMSRDVAKYISRGY